MIRVAVVDDQALVRAGFVALIDADPDLEVVGEAADGRTAVGVARRTRPHVMLMDIRMPEVDGIEATRRIRALQEPPEVLILTTFDTDEHVFDALEAGAAGFLVKDVPPVQLLEAIRAAADGGAVISPTTTRRLLGHLLGTRSDASPPVPDAVTALTDREHEVLLLVARGLSNREIATRLTISETTAKTHVSRVLGKLGLRRRGEAAALAHRVGLVQAHE